MQGIAHFKSLPNPNQGVTSPKATECEPFNLSVGKAGGGQRCNAVHMERVFQQGASEVSTGK